MKELVALWLWAGFCGWLIVIKWRVSGRALDLMSNSHPPIAQKALTLIAEGANCMYCVGWWGALAASFALGLDPVYAVVASGGAAWIAGTVHSLLEQ